MRIISQVRTFWKILLMNRGQKEANKIVVGKSSNPSGVSTQDDLQPKSNICEEDLQLLSHQKQESLQGDQPVIAREETNKETGGKAKQRQPSFSQCLRQFQEGLKTSLQDSLQVQSDFPMVRFDELWFTIQPQFQALAQSTRRQEKKMCMMKAEMLRMRKEISLHQKQKVENSQRYARIEGSIRDYRKEVTKLQRDDMEKSEQFSEVLKYLITIKDLIDSEKGPLFNTSISGISKDTDAHLSTEVDLWNHSFNQSLSEMLGNIISNSKISFSQSSMEICKSMLSKISQKASSKLSSQRSAQNEVAEQRETAAESSTYMEGIFCRSVNQQGRAVEYESERAAQTESIHLQEDLTTASSELPNSVHDDSLYHQSSTLASDMNVTRVD